MYKPEYHVDRVYHVDHVNHVDHVRFYLCYQFVSGPVHRDDSTFISPPVFILQNVLISIDFYYQ